MRLKLLTMAGAAAILMTGSAADAAVTFQFSGVTFKNLAGTDAGTLTGTFTTDDALANIVDFDITASAAIILGGTSFSGLTFNRTNAEVVAATLPLQFFRIATTNPYGGQLQIFFNSPLTTSGTTIDTNSSYENEGFSGNRLPTGSITAVTTAVPEPATWSMMMVGAALIAGSIRYRRRKSIVTFA